MKRFLPYFLVLLAGTAQAQGFSTHLLRTYDDFAADAGSPCLGDFNRDGRLDAAVLNFTGDSLLVRLGDGFGNLGTINRLATGAGARALVAGDLNADGVLDLVTANETAQTVSVFVGLANGQFSKKFDFTVPGKPAAVAIGDVTGDTFVDVVTANPDSNTVTILYGNGTGTGITGASLNLAVPFGPISVALADLDNNGLNDIAVADRNTNKVSVLRAQPAGGFAPKLDYTTASNPTLLRVADLDNDGDPDLVTLSESPGKLSTLYNNGSGAFPFHDELSVTSSATGLEIGDLDGDAIPDAAVGVDQVTILQGSGFGTFFNPTIYSTRQAFTRGLALGDLDGDGRLDVFATAARVVALLAAPSPFGDHQDFTAGTSPEDVTIGDVNGDGRLDIVSANTGGANVSVLINAGTGLFPNHVEYPTSPYPSVVRLGDAGQEGRPEIFVATFSPFISDTNRVWMLPNLGDGTFGPRAGFDPLLDGIGGLALGDVNGDAHLDFVDTHWDGGQSRIFLGDGNGAFAGQPPITTLSHPGNMVLTDVNADQKLDLLQCRYGANSVAYSQGDGAGHYSTPYIAGTGANGTRDVAAGDVDRDGIVDVAALNAGTHSISLFKGANLPGLSAAESHNLLGAVSGLAVRDVNRDGIVDIVFGSDAVSTLFGQGSNVIGVSGGPFFGTAAVSPPIGEKYGLALADLDKNGTLDAVVAGYSTNAVSIFYGLQQARTALTVSPNPAPVGTTLTFKARVTSAWPDSSAPTGNVRFFDGFTLLGSAALVNGVATFTHDATLLWERSFRAEYLGDFHFHRSFSPSIPQTTYPPNVGVLPAGPLRLALAPLSNPSTGAIRIRIDLAADSPARVILVDVRGRVVSSRMVGGSGVVEFGDRLARGVYLVRLEQGKRVATTRAVVL